MKSTGIVVIGAALIAACSPDAPVETPRAEPVVVYAARNDEDALPSLFERYQRETGVVVIVRQADASQVVDDVIGNRISPPADLLVTRSVVGMHRAADEGALRPVLSTLVEQRVPVALRDPEGFWAALTYRRAAIAWNPGAVDGTQVPDFEALAVEALRGKLCLSSSTESHNRAVIAMLIDRLGVHDAELVVRGWIANLAAPVFPGQQQLVEALQAGRCGVSLVSSAGLARLGRGELQSRTPRDDSADIDAVGIARHARNPDGALRLLEWLLDSDVQRAYAAGTFSLPVVDGYDGERNVSLVGWHAEEALRLAERARYP